MKTKNLVLTAMLFAAAIVLSIVENLLPPLPVPGARFGLSNIAVMYALFFINTKSAFAIALLKGAFAVLTRGLAAGFLSAAGGLLSILMMVLLLTLFKDKISYFILSMTGAVSHNIGQFIAVSILYQGMALWFYLPLLLIFGIMAGFITSILLKFILPAFRKLGLK